MLARGIEGGQNPRNVYDAWKRVNLGEAMVDGTILAGDGQIGPAQVLLLLGGTLAFAKSIPEPASVTRRPQDPPSLTDPMALFYKSAEDIADAFNDAGYVARVRDGYRGSRARIVEVSGYREISQVQTHPGGGRHEGRCVKISTNQHGIIKVVDPATYRASKGEKAAIIEYVEAAP